MHPPFGQSRANGSPTATSWRAIPRGSLVTDVCAILDPSLPDYPGRTSGSHEGQCGAGQPNGTNPPS